MDVRKGKIEDKKVTEGTATKGKNKGKKYKRYEFTIEGRKYSTFSEKIGEKFEIGDYVEMEGYQKGPYWNMQVMRIVEPEEDKEIKKDVDVQFVQDQLSQMTEILRKIYAEVKDGNKN